MSEAHEPSPGPTGLARPLADALEEGVRLSTAVRTSGLSLRITGGVAIGMRCPSAGGPALRRVYADIDLFGLRKEARDVSELLTSLGYEPDVRFNTLHGSRRLFFWDPLNSRQLDVFLDVFDMCHRIDLTKRLRLPDTVALADLLLMKLQVVETNEKDFKDVLALLLDHSFGADDEVINIVYIAELASADWGLWRTTTMVAERAGHYAAALPGFEAKDRAHAQVRAFIGALEDAPKSRSWKVRSRVGERLRWYQLPEESH